VGVAPTLNAKAQQALDLLQLGRRVEAETLLHGILKVQPRHFHALHLLGIIALEKHDADAAVAFLSGAVAENPGAAAAHSNLAVALLARQRPAEALHHCERALAIQPDHAQAFANRGQALRLLARTTEALLCFDQALGLESGLLEAHAGRGNTLFDLRRYEEALAQFERLRQLQPASTVVLNDMARTLLRLHRPHEALPLLDEALRRDPAFVAALNNRGSALRELQRPDAALVSYQQALRHDARRSDVHSNIANLMLYLGRMQEALDASELALQIDPELIEASDIRAQALRSLGRLPESVLAHRRLLELDPKLPYALGKYVHAQAAVCDWSQQHEFVARIDTGVSAAERVCTPMIYLALSGSPAAQLQCARAYAADFLAQRAGLAGGAPYRHERPRIAYLSADFRDHPVAHLIAGIFERHDRSAFEVFGIYTDLERRRDLMNERIVAALEHFYDVGGNSDHEVATLLRRLEVDIAVDLGGHTRGSRLGILAYRPAPVQVSFLGFMGTTGTDFIDYVIGDSMALPARMQPFFTERFVHLPHCFLPNDDAQHISDRVWSRAEAGLPAAGLVFCAFNSPYKINAATFDLWAQLLREVPGSVLWLKDGAAPLCENLRSQASLRQLDPARLVFAPAVTSMAEHLARYRLADLFLDTAPYGAHATARDALWAGLPVLTCLGDAFVGRVGASLLHGLGLDELIAADPGEYLAKAIALGRSPATLAAIRARLAGKRNASPVFCTERYCRDLEAAFTIMLQGAGVDRTRPASAKGR
jgi:protein O-GlcNAc transferase